MVELQIVVLVVAGSSPVGHPSFLAKKAMAYSMLKSSRMHNPADLFVPSSLQRAPRSFWERIFTDHELDGCDNLEKLLAGCEIIAAVDRVDLLDAA